MLFAFAAGAQTKIVLLGTGTPCPYPHRSGRATAIVVGDTHLHSDHTTGLPHLILTPWVMGRTQLDIYGPEGTEEMTQHVLAALHRDIDVQTKGPEQTGAANGARARSEAGRGVSG